jgi:hypothetical protein
LSKINKNIKKIMNKYIPNSLKVYIIRKLRQNLNPRDTIAKNKIEKLIFFNRKIML